MESLILAFVGENRGRGDAGAGESLTGEATAERTCVSTASPWSWCAICGGIRALLAWKRTASFRIRRQEEDFDVGDREDVGSYSQ